MSGRPPPPPPPPPSAMGGFALLPKSQLAAGRPGAGPPPPPPPPGPITSPSQIPPYKVESSEDYGEIDDNEDRGNDAYDEMMNINTEEEIYAEEDEDENDPSIPMAPPEIRQPSPAAPHSATRTPPPLPKMPPPLPSMPPPPVVDATVPQPGIPSSAETPPPPQAYQPAPPQVHSEKQSDPVAHDGLETGSQVYKPDLANVWAVVTVTGKVNRDPTSKLYHIKHANGNKDEVDFASVPYHPVNPKIMADMTALHYIHEPGILYNLKGRFLTQNLPYTYMASALIAVNPLRSCPEPAMSAYINIPVNQVAPHPYAVAEAAYQNLSFSQANQSIIISGVSGAGKTETAKIILRYLSARSPENSAGAALVASGRGSTRTTASSILLHKVEGLDSKLVDSSPLLESFGNAKTLRNNNSSRFGKFLKLCFSNGIAPAENANAGSNQSRTNSGGTGMTLIGALVETYLLEKNRVITQGIGECNFHIFYQLLNSRYAQALYLKDAKFSILSEESIKLFSQIKEASSLAVIEASLTTLGLSTGSIDNIWRILAGIMHLSNIVFEDHDTTEGNIAIIEHKSMTYLRYTAELWSVDQYALLNLLTKREMFTRGEAYLVQYTVKEANFARDATAKSVYEALFAYIVRAINRSLVQLDAAIGGNPVVDLNKQYFIGVLDIFGFENFAENGFEQLLINFANEALQNTFNEQLFEKELELFRNENIDFNVSECPNNRGCVALIAGRSAGIFKTLDSVSRQPKPSDERFCEELHKAFCSEKAYFLPVHRKDMRSKFTIKHYAGEVTYTVCATSVNSASARNAAAARDGAAALAQNSSWIIKNNDSIPDALTTLYGESKLPEFCALAGVEPSSYDDSNSTAISAGAGSRSSVSGVGPVRRKSVMMKPTIVHIFSKSMDDLNALLLSTMCQFVRCIKPNEDMRPGDFDNIYAMEQIRSLGILQACEVLKVSLPTRITYSQLRSSLSALIRKVSHLFKAESEVVLIACLLRAFNISTDLYRLGKTMVFFRPGQLARLEIMLNAADASEEHTDVVARIEESHAVNQKGLALVRKAETNLEEIAQQFAELEKKFERLNNKSKNLPEVRSLDIPEDLVQKISLIESFTASASRKHQNLNVRLLKSTATLEDATEMKGISDSNLLELKRQGSVCTNEVNILQQLLHEAQSGYEAFNKKIQAMEDQCGGIGNLFNETIEKNDDLYEKIQDTRNTFEDLIIRAKEQAERCQLDKVEALVQQAGESGRVLQADMQELQRGIAIALAEIEKFEGAGENMDFGESSQLAVGIINKLDHCQRGIANSESTVAQLERSIKTAKAGAKIEGVPPPRPTTQAPEVSAPSSDVRSAGVNFSVRDLAALRKKKASEESASGSSTPPISVKPGTSIGSVSSASVQIDRKADSDQLPPHWVEKLDKKSGRLYYVNEETKARQWKKPVWDTVVESAHASSVAVEDEDGLISYVLPPNWKELVDKKTGRTYYVNSVTKERQWRRPDNTRKSGRLSESPVKSEDAAGDVQNNRKSRRFRGTRETPAYLSEEQGGSLSDRAVNKVALARKNSMRLLEMDVVPEELKNTVSYMCRIGTVNKKGFLLKQGKFIGRWKRRHFVLTDDLLEYWDRMQDYALGKEGKTFFLSGSCQTAFTSTQNCFCVSNPSDEDESSSWYLLADSEEEMLDWMSAINAHIHMRYLAEWHINTDFWERGNVETSFWRMPAAAVKDVLRRPVGIRTLPINDGPRTGEGIYPGEIVEVVQIIEQPAARHVWPQRFLRLADDRGWVLENHPKANYAVMVPVPGEYLEDSTLRYVYSADCLEDLEVYNSPNCDEEHLTGLTLHPGSIIRAVAQWTTTSGAIAAVAPGESGEVTDAEEEDGNEVIVFVKLADGLGWVPMYHPITGGQILSLVSTQPLKKGVSTNDPTASIKPSNNGEASTTKTKSAASTKSKTSKAKVDNEEPTDSSRPALRKEKSKKVSSSAEVADSRSPATGLPPPPPPPPSTAVDSTSKSKKQQSTVTPNGNKTPSSSESTKTVDTSSSGKAKSALDVPRRRVVKPISDT